MTLLNRKIDYALLILCYLYHQVNGGSAREIATHFGISRAFVANILKSLCQQWFVVSARGVNGGYQLSPSTSARTLADLIDALESPVQLAECNDGVSGECCALAQHCPIRTPIAEIHGRIRAVLEGVRLVEIFTAPAEDGRPQPVLLELSRCAAPSVR